MIGPRLLLISTVVAALALAPAAQGQIAKSGHGYLFRVKFTAGSTIRYSTVISTKISKQMASFVMPMSRKITAIHKGTADLVVTEGPLKFNGNTVSPARAIGMTIDRLGRVVSSKGSASIGVTKFPQSPISTGSIWTGTLPIPMGGSGETSTVDAAFRFVKMTTYRGQRAAQISVTFTKPGGKIPITGKGTIYILASDGNILHSSVNFSVQPEPDMEPSSVTAEITRL